MYNLYGNNTILDRNKYNKDGLYKRRSLFFYKSSHKCFDILTNEVNYYRYRRKNILKY